MQNLISMALNTRDDKVVYRGPYLNESPANEVSFGYFRMPLAVYKDVCIVDNIHGCILYYYTPKRKGKDKYYSGLVRFSKLTLNKKGIRGWYDSRNRFHKWNTTQSTYN